MGRRRSLRRSRKQLPRFLSASTSSDHSAHALRDLCARDGSRREKKRGRREGVAHL